MTPYQKKQVEFFSNDKKKNIEKCNKVQSNVKNDLNEDEWDWYEIEDKQIYFIIATHKWERKGQQVYNCYGRRTNRFLIQW